MSPTATEAAGEISGDRKEIDMTITFLNHNAFEELKGVKKPFHSGWGRGRNVTHIKKDEYGNLYAKLSPIADPIYDGYTQDIVAGEVVMNQLRHFLEEE